MTEKINNQVVKTGCCCIYDNCPSENRVSLKKKKFDNLTSSHQPKKIIYERTENSRFSQKSENHPTLVNTSVMQFIDFPKNCRLWVFPKKNQNHRTGSFQVFKNQNQRTDWFWVFKNPQRINGFRERTAGSFSVLCFFSPFFGF
jgi:hypothetical protein